MAFMSSSTLVTGSSESIPSHGPTMSDDEDEYYWEDDIHFEVGYLSSTIEEEKPRLLGMRSVSNAAAHALHKPKPIKKNPIGFQTGKYDPRKQPQ